MISAAHWFLLYPRSSNRMNTQTKLFATILMTASLTSNAVLADAQSPTQNDLSFNGRPPVAKKVPHEYTVHGDTMKDDYFWLRDKKNPEVAQYLEAENSYADGIMAPTTTLQKKLYDELVSHVKETDVSAPYLQGKYEYYSRTEAGKQYPIYCRRELRLGEPAPEQVILDQNQLAIGQPFMSVNAFTVSDNGRYLAYSTDNTGFRQYTIYVKDLQTGKTFPEQMLKTYSVAWAADNKTLFYTIQDSAKRPYRLMRHELGTDVARDQVVYEEKDEKLDVGISRSRSGKYLFMELSSHTTAEIRYLPADKPMCDFITIAPRIHEQQYFVEDRDGLFYIRSNRSGPTFEVATAPIATPGREHWKVLIPNRPDVTIEDINTFANFLEVSERENGLQQLRIMQMDGAKPEVKADFRISFPEAVYSASVGPNREWNTTKLRYIYQSPITPNSSYDFDVASRKSELVKQAEIPGGFDRNNYSVERIFATAKDGLKVPITVIYRKGVKKDGTAPLYLYGYGSYGSSIPLGFSANRLALLDRGIVVALAHIRGGGDLGKPWHDDGKMMKKMNTFTDFIACAEHLIANKYADPKRIAIEGRSAGGLLMGAVTNMRPDLWKAVLTGVPFVDVMNTMLDASLPLTVGEYEEWGNPNEKAAFDYMMQYSPYDNLKKANYPTILVKTSFNDSQVMYWEPAKYVAKMRALNPDAKNQLILKTNMAAGHGGASGRYDYLHEVAFDYAFFLTQLGVEK
jgi:oligopeptidase B